MLHVHLLSWQQNDLGNNLTVFLVDSPTTALGNYQEMSPMYYIKMDLKAI